MGTESITRCAKKCAWLTKYGVVRRGSIGYFEAQPLTSSVASELRAPSTDGLVVMRISQRSAAYDAGLRPGDVILALNGKAITDAAAFMRTIADAPVGGAVTLEVLREARRQTLKVPVQQEAPRQRRR